MNKGSIIANRLKEYRKYAGKTQKEVSERTGYATASLSCWERGVHTPSVEELMVLVEFYNEIISEKNPDYVPGEVLPSVNSGRSETVIRLMECLERLDEQLRHIKSLFP